MLSVFGSKHVLRDACVKHFHMVALIITMNGAGGGGQRRVVEMKKILSLAGTQIWCLSRGR